MKILTWGAELKRKEQLTEDVFKFSFTSPENFSFKAGQFVSVQFTLNKKIIARAYSILNPPSQEVLDLCVRIIPGGFASKIFENSKIKDEFEMKGPFGHFTFDEKDSNPEFWFLATGTGVIPVYSMINEYLKIYPNKIFKLIFSVKKRKNLIFHQEFLKLEKENRNFVYMPTLTREDWKGKTGRIQTHLGGDLKNKTFYICGLKEFVPAAKEHLLNNKVLLKNIRFERHS